MFRGQEVCGGYYWLRLWGSGQFVGFRVFEGPKELHGALRACSHHGADEIGGVKGRTWMSLGSRLGV